MSVATGIDLASFSDADASAAILRALRTVAVLTLVCAPLVGWKMGWPSAGLLVVGAAISAAGLWKWLRLMRVVVLRMEATGTTADSETSENRPPAALGTVLLGFFVTLALMLAVLYGSLKLLHGSVFALFLGLGLGIVALTVEALKLVKAWTV